MPWYVAQCITSKEDIINSYFNKVFPQFNTLLPRRELAIRRKGSLKTEKKVLFPSYLFFESKEYVKKAEISHILNQFKQKTNLNYLLKILDLNHQNYVGEFVSAVNQEDIALILSLVDENHIIQFSQCIKEKNKIKILSGPLKNKEGMILKINQRKKRAKVKLNIMNKSWEVDIGLELLEQWD